MTPLLRRLAMLLRRGRLARELAEEMRIHLEMAADEDASAGVAADEAARDARRRFGNPALLKEDAAAVWSFRGIESVIQDARHAGRTLARSPGFTAIAVLSLAIGIGANTAIFTLTNAILLRTLPVPDADRLVALESTIASPGSKQRGLVFSYPAFDSLRARADLFASVFAARAVNRANIVGPGGGDAELASGRLVTGAYFDTLGVPAALGRALAPADDGAPGSSAVVVVSDDFWRARLGRDPQIVGRTLRIEDTPFTIVGVMPRGFFGEWIGAQPAFWAPMAMQPQVMGRNQLGEINHDWLILMGRLRPGTSLGETQARLDGFIREARASADPRWAYVERLTAMPGSRGPATEMRDLAGRPLAILTAVVAFVLLIACANLANLLLARAGARRQEIGVRLAIGAARRRVMRQLLTESVVLAFAGSSLGLLLALISTPALLHLLVPPQAQVSLDLGPDLRVLGFTLAVGLATAVAFGLAPAWTATRLPVGAAFGAAAHATGPTGGRMRLGRLLVAVEVALSACLLVGALLFARTLANLAGVHPGFAADDLVLASLSPARGDRSAGEITELYGRLLERLETLPGVHSASLARHVMLGGDTDEQVMSAVAGFTPQSPRDMRVHEDLVGPRYFESTGIGLLAGRDFAATDRRGTLPLAAIVNETAARFYFRGRDPRDVVGRHLTLGKTAVYEIVGVARDSKYNRLRDATPRMLYRCALQLGTTDALTLHVRTATDPLALAAQIRSEVRALSPRMAVAEVMTQAAVVEASLAEERTIAILCGVFGLVALALACLGIYGLLSYSVTRRIPEIGVRLALGARPMDVSWMILREMCVLVAAGALAGVPAAIGLMRLGQSLLFGLTPADPPTLAASLAILVFVSIAAAALPARRASRVDPLRALRYE